MARKLRLEYEGACYHVINRGNYRRDLFTTRGAAEAFEHCLDEACARCGWRVHAFVIMRNHFHLALETPRPNLSLGMKYLQGTWSNRFNRYRGEAGRPFQGRYKALHVQPGSPLAQVAHYIHLNPVRARAVTMERLRGFRWSSLWWFHQERRPHWLTSEVVRQEAGELVDDAAGWRSYHDYLALMMEEDPRARERKFGSMSRGWAIGTRDFRRGLVAEFRERGAALENAMRLGEERGDRAALRDSIWEDALLTAARKLALDLNALGPRKRDPTKLLLAAILKQTTDVSNGWLSTRLDTGAPAAIGQAIRLLQQQDGVWRERLRAALAVIQLAR